MIALLLAAGLARADDPTLSLAETLRLVIEQNPDRKAATLGEAIAAIDARRARLDRFTAQVTADAGATVGTYKAWSQPAVDASGTSWETRATAGLPLYAGGAVNATIASADASAGIASLDRELTDRSLQRAAYTAYWNIKGTEQQIAAAEEGLSLTRQSLAIIGAKADAGLAAGIDVNRAKVDLYSQEESLLVQQNALYQAEQELLRLLHLSADGVTLTDEPPSPTTERVVLPQDAGSARPELARKELEADRAEAGIVVARSGALPSLALTGTVGAGRTSAGILGDGGSVELGPDLDASVGLTLAWNPFDLFRVRDAVAQARLASEQVDAATASEKDSITAEIRQAAATVDQLRQRVPLSDAQVALARDNLQIVQGLYSQGSASILDLFDAQSAFRQARTQGATLRVDLATAEYDLRWLLGDDLTPSGATP